MGATGVSVAGGELSYTETVSHTDVGQAVVQAPPGTVFAALVSEEARTSWLPPAGMSGRFTWFDARPGGGYRLTLSYDDVAAPGKAGDNTDVVEVRFVVLDEPGLLVEQAKFVSDDPMLAGTMTMTWSVDPVDDGSLVVITAKDVPDGISSEDHATAFASTLRQLDEYLRRPIA